MMCHEQDWVATVDHDLLNGPDIEAKNAKRISTMLTKHVPWLAMRMFTPHLADVHDMYRSVFRLLLTRKQREERLFDSFSKACSLRPQVSVQAGLALPRTLEVGGALGGAEDE
jgi:hypothetical protein